MMKINRSTVIPNANLYQQVNAEQMRKSQTESKKDQVQISDKAKIMLEKSSVDQARHEKIKDLTEQVQGGNYKVNSQKVAEQVYQFWLTK